MFIRKSCNIYTFDVPRSLHRPCIYVGRARTASRGKRTRRHQARAACFHVRAHQEVTRWKTEGYRPPRAHWNLFYHNNGRLGKNAVVPSSPHATGEVGVPVGRARPRPRVGPVASRIAWEREGLTEEGLRKSEPITVGCTQGSISTQRDHLC